MLDKLAFFLLCKGAEVAPYVIDNYCKQHGVKPLLNIEQHKYIVRTRLGFYVHTFVLERNALTAAVQKQTVVQLSKFCSTSLCQKYIIDNAQNFHLFVYSRKSELYVKSYTAYNIYSKRSLLAEAKKKGLKGLNLELVYSEYTAAFRHVAMLVKKNVLIQTKTRLYLAALAVPNI